MRGIVFVGDGKAEVTDGLEVPRPGSHRGRRRHRERRACATATSASSTAPFPGRRRRCWATRARAWSRRWAPRSPTLKPGDHVVLATIANCGMCAACNTGHPTWCRQTMGVMDKPFTFNGEPAWNFAATSVFAERTVVKETQAVRIDDDVPLSSACLIGCGVLTGVGAALNRAQCSTARPRGVRRRRRRAQRHPGPAHRRRVAHHRGRHGRGQGAARPPVRRHRLHRRHRHRHGQGDPQAAAVRAGRKRHRPVRAPAASTGPSSASATPHVLRNAIDVLDWGGNW